MELDPRSTEPRASRVDERAGIEVPLSELVGGSPNMIAVLDLELRFLAFNERYAASFVEVFGMRPVLGACQIDEAAGTPERAAQVRALLARVVDGENVVVGHVGGGPPASRRTYELAYGPLRNGDGAVWAIFVAVADHTVRERARARQALTAQVLGRLNAAGARDDVIRDILLLVREFAGVEAVGIRLAEGGANPSFLVHGFEDGFIARRHALCARNDGAPPSPDGLPCLDCIGRAMLRSAEPGVRGGHATAKGSFWTAAASGLDVNGCAPHDGFESVALVPLRSGDEIIGLLHLADRRPGLMDETVLEFLEQIGDGIGVAFGRRRLEESAARFRAALEQAGDAFFVIDRATLRYVDVNRAAIELSGCTRDELLGLGPHDTVVGLTRERLGRRLDAILARGTLSFDARFRRKDGSIVPVEVRLSTFGHAERTLVLATVHDATERQEAERERTRIEEQLRQSQKMEAIGLLAGGIAHDFNNLLSAILGYAELAQAELPVDESPFGMVGEIRRAGERAKTLTQQLLAFSRRQVLAMRPIDLNAVVRDVEGILRRVIGETIDVVLALDPRIRVVQADAAQIQQLILNLAVNARDAMAGRGRLTLSTANGVDRDVLLEVSDTGCGMEPHVMAHIFEPFFTTKPAGHGTGLGLSTVHGIVTQHGGDIAVRSAPGQGSTFTVRLPAAAGLPVHPGEPAGGAEGRGTETILVVEDDDSVRGLACRILAGCGYTVLPAGATHEAVRHLVEHRGPIHLLLTDVVMPGLNGREMFSLARQVVPGLRVVYMSGYTDEVIARHGILEPGTHFVQKPFSREQLLRALRAAMTEEPVAGRAG